MRQPVLPLAIVYAMSLAGFPLLASVLSLVGAPDTPLFTIVLRVLVGALAAVAVLRYRRVFPVRNLPFVSLFVLFWTAYCLRVAYDAYVLQRFSPGFTPTVVFVWTALFVLGPSLSMFFGFDRRAVRAAHAVLAVVVVAAALILLYQSTGIILRLLEKGSNIRFEFERLGPIGVGYLGGMLVLLAAAGLVRSLERFAPVRSAWWLAGLCLGLYIVLIAASKGPAVSAISALLALWLVPLRVSRIAVGVGVAALLAFGVARLQTWILFEYDFDVFARFVEATDGGSESVDSRTGFYVDAWRDFLASPLFGSSLFVGGDGAYTHNLTLEAFMATGIVGGVAYLAMCALMLVSAVRLLAARAGFEWLAMLGIYYFVGGMFSGAHFTSYAHYVSMVAVVMTDAALRQDSLVWHRPPRTRARGLSNWFGVRPQRGRSSRRRPIAGLANRVSR